ncbi:MAG: HAD-IIB family hydrolase [Actinomycetota bacterium]
MLPLICIDVDGTLVGASGEPTDAVWAAADAAVARGQHLALTTARGAFGPTFDWARRLDPDGWHVFHAGAALVHAGTGEVVEQPVPTEVVELAGRAAADQGWTVEYYTTRDYRVSDDGVLATDHAALMGVGVAVGSPADMAGAVVRVQLVVPHDIVPEAVATMEPHAEVSTATSPVQEGVTFVSITPHGATKAAAIEAIAGRLGTTLERVMMVGDGHNDLGAMQAVRHGVAMGNAEPEVKAAARYEVPPVSADGLAVALQLAANLD